MSDSCFSPGENLWDLAFEPTCKIPIVRQLAFELCESFQSIYIHSFVQTISQACFANDESVSTLIFEFHSEISVIIEGFAFGGCGSLQSICLLTSLRDVSVLAVAGCGVRGVTGDSGNQFLRVSRSFLSDFSGSRLIRHFDQKQT
jgi:hypothetical protein